MLIVTGTHVIVVTKIYHYFLAPPTIVNNKAHALFHK